jgi:hypothetical protein
MSSEPKLVMGIPAEQFRVAIKSTTIIAATETKVPVPDTKPTITELPAKQTSTLQRSEMPGFTSGPHSRVNSRMPELEMYGERGYWAYGACD